MNPILQKLHGWWQNADRTQKIVTLGGGGLLAALLIVTFVVSSRPKMSIVFANLQPGDAGSVQMEIDSMGIPVTMDNGGNVSVPSDKVALVRARLAQNNKLPKISTHPGFEGLDKMGMMNTPKVEEERLKSMLEGELSKTVELFDGVDTAAVHLTFGVDSPFETEKKDARASVALSERAGGTVNAGEGKAMATLIASSVPGLDAKKVSIFSRDGRTIFDGASADDSSGAALSKLDLEKKEGELRRTELQETLNRVVGPGNSIVTVNLTLDTNQIEESSNLPVPVKGTSEEEKVQEKMSGDGAGSQGGPADFGGAPGAAGTKPAPTAGSGYTRTQEHKNPTNGWTESHTKRGVGEVKSMAVTVFLNKPKADTNADPAAEAQTAEREEAVRRAVNTFLGLAKKDPAAAVPPLSQTLAFDAKEGFGSEIISYAFDDKVAKDSDKATADQAGQQKMSQIISIVPVAVLAILGFFVLRLLGKVTKGAAAGPALALAGAGAPVIGPVNYGAQALPAGSNIDDLRARAKEAGISEEELDVALAAAGEQGLTMADIPSIAKRINLPLEQIRKMGEERPEVVAMLVKSWLLEDRR